MDKRKALLVLCISAVVLAVSVQECQCWGEDIVEGAKEKAGSVSNWFSDKFSPENQEKMKKEAKEVGSEVGDAASKAKDATSDAADKVSDAASSTWDKVKGN